MQIPYDKNIVHDSPGECNRNITRIQGETNGLVSENACIVSCSKPTG